MEFGGINYLAVLVAAVAAFAAGAIYYGALGKPWMKAARIDPADAKMQPSLFAINFVCELVIAWVLAGVIGHLGEGEVTVRNGIISGAFAWLGFIAAPMTVNHRYQGFGWNLTLIDAGHWLIVLLLMGGIIGAFGI